MSSTAATPSDDDDTGVMPAAQGDNSGSEGQANTETTSRTEQLRVIGGLLALTAGLIALIVVVVVSLLVKTDTTGGSIATAAIGVIGSTVGAYFGVKVGSDGTKAAVEAQQKEAAKAQVFALHTPPDQANVAFDQAERLVKAHSTTN